jgi:hypothetical protein
MRESGAWRKVGIAVAMLFGLWTGIASATTLWYNGDFDGNNGLLNEKNAGVSDSRVYDDFIVPVGQNWNIQSVWSNDLSNFSWTSAYWEIRSGVSVGNGGTLVAGGVTSAASQTDTGRNGDGYEEYQALVSGLNIDLGPGTYWLTVAPVDDGSGASFDSTTSGANAVGTPPGNDGQSFWDSTSWSESFASSTASDLGQGTWDFSMGVAGSTGEGSPIPEPATLSLLGLGLTGLVAKVLRRKNR